MDGSADGAADWPRARLGSLLSQKFRLGNVRAASDRIPLWRSANAHAGTAGRGRIRVTDLLRQCRWTDAGESFRTGQRAGRAHRIGSAPLAPGSPGVGGEPDGRRSRHLAGLADGLARGASDPADRATGCSEERQRES